MREGIVAIASAIDEDPEELLEAATAGANWRLIRAKEAVDRVEKDLERMSRERLLPRVEILEKVARYEAHLSRGLYKAMHELEALQTRRLGGSAGAGPAVGKLRGIVGRVRRSRQGSILLMAERRHV